MSTIVPTQYTMAIELGSYWTGDKKNQTITVVPNAVFAPITDHTSQKFARNILNTRGTEYHPIRYEVLNSRPLDYDARHKGVVLDLSNRSTPGSGIIQVHYSLNPALRLGFTAGKEVPSDLMGRFHESLKEMAGRSNRPMLGWASPEKVVAADVSGGETVIATHAFGKPARLYKMQTQAFHLLFQK